jgi:hypothetical protein
MGKAEGKHESGHIDRRRTGWLKEAGQPGYMDKRSNVDTATHLIVTCVVIELHLTTRPRQPRRVARSRDKYWWRHLRLAVHGSTSSSRAAHDSSRAASSGFMVRRRHLFDERGLACCACFVLAIDRGAGAVVGRG